MDGKNEFDKLIKELFSSINIDGLTSSNILKLTYLFENLNQCSSFFSSLELLGLIFLLERLGLNNVLIKLNIDTYKNNFIFNLIETNFKKQNSFDDGILVSDTFKKEEEKISEEDNDYFDNSSKDPFFNTLFTKEDDGNFYYYDKDSYPEKGALLKVRRSSENENGWIYTIDHTGKLLLKTREDDDVEAECEKIDYNEVYSSLLEDILKYDDNQESIQEEELIREE